MAKDKFISPAYDALLRGEVNQVIVRARSSDVASDALEVIPEQGPGIYRKRRVRPLQAVWLQGKVYRLQPKEGIPAYYRPYRSEDGHVLRYDPVTIFYGSGMSYWEYARELRSLWNIWLEDEKFSEWGLRVLSWVKRDVRDLDESQVWGLGFNSQEQFLLDWVGRYDKHIEVVPLDDAQSVPFMWSDFDAAPDKPSVAGSWAECLRFLCERDRSAYQGWIFTVQPTVIVKEKTR